jgi:small conductance mechanosensitive channel
MIMEFLRDNWKYILGVVVILCSALLVSRYIRLITTRYIKKSAEKIKVDPTTFNFAKHAFSFIVFLIALFLVFYSIPTLRALGLTLFASASIFAAILGFASQHAFANIISGIFIVIFKPFRVGDTIKIGTEHLGKVEDITLRHTVIRNFEHRRIIIPNSVISSETIVNSNITDEKICIHVEIGISYDSDIDKAIYIMQDEAQNHLNFIDNRTDEQKQEGRPPVIVRVISLGEYFILLRAYVWAKDADSAFVMRCDLYKSIKQKFDQNGIEIPFPYRTIVYKKDMPNKPLQED